MRHVRSVLFALLLVSFGQAQQTWTRTYGGAGDDEGYSVQQTTDGGYVVAGYTGSFGAGNLDVYLIKTDAFGDTLWTRAYGGAGPDVAYSVQQTSDGGYIVAGWTESFGPTLENVYLLKTDASGDSLWTRNYGGRETDVAHSVQQTSDGGYIVVGTTNSFGDQFGDVWLIKTDSSGDTTWARTYGGTSFDGGYAVQQTLDGGYIIVGYTFAAGLQDVYLVKTNAAGDTLWTKTYGGMHDDLGYSVQQTLDGGYIIAGVTASFGAGGDDVYLIKTNASGDTIWTRTYGGTNDDRGNSVRQTTDGGYVVAGWTGSFGAGRHDVYLVKTNAAGDTLWTRTYGGTGYDQGYSVQQTVDGGYVVAGPTNSFGGTDTSDVYLIKTDANGNAGVEEQGGSRQEAGGSMKATPNPFASLARIPGHEAERFDLYDISGKKVGAYPGNRIGEGLSPAVYFIRLDGRHGGALRVVKVK